MPGSPLIITPLVFLHPGGREAKNQLRPVKGNTQLVLKPQNPKRPLKSTKKHCCITQAPFGLELPAALPFGTLLVLYIPNSIISLAELSCVIKLSFC